MSPLNKTQVGIAGQQEFCKLVILGSSGRLEPSVPYSDDERRDFEIRLTREFARSLAVQVKCASRLVKGVLLVVHFVVSARRLVDDPRFWYFFAYLDRRQMTFRDPVFLVPSTVVHAHGHKMSGRRKLFTFTMSLAPGSHDQWSGYRLSPLALGKRIVQIIRGLPLRAGRPAQRAAIATLPDVVFVGRHRSR